MRKKKEKAANGQEPKKKGKKRLFMVLGLVVILLAGGAYFALGKNGTAQAKPVPKPGTILKLDPIYLNLSDGHYLKLGLALQETTDATTDVDGSQALDAAISLFSQTSMAALSTPAGRLAVKKELIDKIANLYPGKVMTIYYTEFVMQ